MKYYFLKTLFNVTFEQAIKKVTKELKNECFDIVSEIDIRSTLKEKLNADFRKYIIIGTINPTLLKKALNAELNIGTMLPWNVVVMEMDDGMVRVSAIEPLASVVSVSNKELDSIAKQINIKLQKVLNNL
jgi:uncharacterized protein (DUF302 family)